MVAACKFAALHVPGKDRAAPAQIKAELYGSLALTGKGHATDRAILLGLSGFQPHLLCPDEAAGTVDHIRSTGQMMLGQHTQINFSETRDILFYQRERLPFHSNGMRFTSYDADGTIITERIYYSTGGGAVVDEDAIASNAPPDGLVDIPFPFCSSAQLLQHCADSGLSIGEIVLHNECASAKESIVKRQLLEIRSAMASCIDRGCITPGELPGGLKVKRRAPDVLRILNERQTHAQADPLAAIDWVNLWALAVNEENAAGGRVVTAPTNGAAGIIPAVLRYYERFVPGANSDGCDLFLLTACAIGSLFKENASISGAEVGCQGEVGVACSMAAAGLTAVMGGTPLQVENAAEIGMEHNLGLTCDPVGGLVQIPCIERNAVGAIQAIEASRLALLGDGHHRVTLDQVIETMRKTGLDMGERYKETSLGGLAVNVVEC